MRELNLDELKVLQFEILCKVDEFCRKNHIEYSLTYGSLIGAVRHKGYIPWDDDIDIMMTRSNYMRFIKSFNGEYDNLHVISPEININYYAPFANVCDKRTILDEGDNSHRGIDVGVKIDIFPIDATPNDEEEYRKLVEKLKKIKVIMAAKRNTVSLNWIKYPKGTVLLLYNKIRYISHSYSYYQEQISNLINKYDNTEAKYVDMLVFPIYPYTRLDKLCFDNYINIEFEGKMLRCIKDYDAFLSVVYGDYMVLPPKEKQVSRHCSRAYWKE